MVTRPRNNSTRWIIRAISATCALLVMYLYSTTTLQHADSHSLTLSSNALGESDIVDKSWNVLPANRHLLSVEVRNGSSGLGDDDEDNCTRPRSHHGYKDSCEFVRNECQNEMQLLDYLGFVVCNMKNIQPLAYVILAAWLVYLISLLATTADYFFVPPLNILAEKLRLSPSIAGITLLAIGNGAPDVFTAYAALKNHEQGREMALVLGALIGASIFISTVVLGSIILIVQVKKEDINRVDFVRDVIAYMCVVALVAGVAVDGKVHLYEAVAFPIFYIIYIAVVVAISYLRACYEKRTPQMMEVSEHTSLLGESSTYYGVQEREIVKEIAESMMNGESSDTKKLVLQGLTWPRGSHIGAKFQWLVEWPFSLIRWLSIPACYHDGQWSQFHHWFAVTSPVPVAMVLLVAAKGWDGFSIQIGNLPLFAFLFILGTVLSVLLFFLLKPDQPPHWTLQIILGVAAFVMSIAWLNIEANETVSVLQAFGLLLNIDNAILGLTVLAIGNSVGDWVADTAVSRAGKPGMGVASCFGSPLLNDVLGLSVALITRIAIYDQGQTYVFPINENTFDEVKLSWIFLGISLLSSAIVFPLFKFSPPRIYGVVLIYIYIVFMVFSVLATRQIHLLPIHFHSK